tara:strand:+ start:896 stop:1066 length:171 start_codon:yes stop_codon:yes gene_type:complete
VVNIKKYRVRIVHTNIFYIDAEDEIEAERIAVEERTWLETKTLPDYSGADIEVEEV